MNSTRTIRIGLVALAGCVAGFAQMQHNIEKQLTCQNRDHDGQQARHCEIREQAVASVGLLNLESGNGAVMIKRWLQSGVLVRARSGLRDRRAGGSDASGGLELQHASRPGRLRRPSAEPGLQRRVVPRHSAAAGRTR